MAWQENYVGAVVNEDIYLTVPKRKKSTIKAIIEYNSPIKSPIKKGEKIGLFHVYQNDELIKTIDIFAHNDVKRANIFIRLFKSLNYLVWGDV